MVITGSRLLLFFVFTERKWLLFVPQAKGHKHHQESLAEACYSTRSVV